jgi:prepilin signal peptidase PulO-like enzyme (type II secretory pathway)
MTSFAAAVSAVAAAVLAGPAAVDLARASLQQTAKLGVVETAALATAIGLAFTALVGRSPTIAVVGLPLLVLGLAAAAVDALEHRLPDVLTGAVLAHTTGLVVGLALADGAVDVLLRSTTAAALLTGLALIAKATRGAAIGWGDIKLLPSLGAVLGWAGWDALTTAVLLWALFIALTAMLSSATGDHRDVVPYGPALLAGP